MKHQESAFIANNEDGLEYDSAKALDKTQPKYLCMVTGDKRMTPCAGCSSLNTCTSRAMQYKEIDQMDEKAVVKISADGKLIACAKGADASECGYEPGAKVCGKCGAMAVQVKIGEDEMMDEEAPMASAEAPEPAAPEAMPAEEPEEEAEDEEEMKMVCPKCSYKNEKGSNFCAKCGTKLPSTEEKMYGSEDDGAMMGTELPKKPKPMMDEEPMKGGMGMNDEDMSEMQRMAAEEMRRRRMARERRMDSMGMKSADWDDDAYLCGFQKKMLPGSHTPCIACPGGCAPEQGLPTLIEVEGIAEEMFAGKSIRSGYSDIKDMFIVQVKSDDRIIEAAFDGQTARCKGWKELDQDFIDMKSADRVVQTISFEEAAQIAVKSIEGDIVSVDADDFEGHEAYAVEVNGVDGRSYDVYVSLDGQVLGYDEYDAEEAMAIDAEIAEIALKRAYGIDERQEMAKRGEAMEDGSFPIKDEADLRNAIMAHGRAKDVDAAKAHIKKRAKELGLEEMLPSEWSDGSGEKALTVDSDPEMIAKLLEFEMMALDEETSE